MLIDLNNLNKESASGANDFFICNADLFEKIETNVELKRININENGVYPYFQENKFSTHELLFYFLKQTGPADVYFTTWGLGKKMVELLASAITMKSITYLAAILDKRIILRKEAIYDLCKSIAHDVVTLECHAKLFVIRNEKYSIACITSGNFTENKRIEAGTLYVNKEVAEFLISQIKTKINAGKHK